MNIRENLTRIINAKADLKTAIEAKGVTIPSDALIDTYPPYIDAMDTPHWLGSNAEKVSDFYTKSYKLADTGYATWTPSTTAAAIVATENAGTFSADLENYEYWVRWQFCAEFEHLSGQTLKAVPEIQTYSLWQTLHKRPYGFAQFETMEDSRNYSVNAFTGSSYIIYRNTSGTRTWTTGISYGIYPAAQACTFSNATSDTPTVTLHSPTINARCSSTYFATARAQYVDTDNTMLKVKGTLYRVKKGTSCVRQFYLDAIDLLNNPL